MNSNRLQHEICGLEEYGYNAHENCLKGTCGICGFVVVDVIKLKTPVSLSEYDFEHKSTRDQIYVCCNKAWLWDTNENCRPYQYDLPDEVLNSEQTA